MEKIKVAVTYNYANPKKISYEEVEVIDTFIYGDYTLCIHNNHNPVIGGTSVSEIYTGAHVRSFKMQVSRGETQKLKDLKKATETYLDQFSDLIGDKVKKMDNVNGG